MKAILALAAVLFFAGGCSPAIVSDAAAIRSHTAGVLAMATLAVEEQPATPPAPVPTPKPPGIRDDMQEPPRIEVDPTPPRRFWRKRGTQAIVFSINPDECPPCKKLEAETFPALKKAGWTIGDPLAGQFDIYVAKLGDDKISDATAKQYKIDSFPTTIVLDEAGREVGRVVGFQSGLSLSAWLNRITRR